MLAASTAPLSAAYDVALLDLDGVLYLGAEPIAHAAASVADARRQGMRAAFVTNNASRSPARVAEHLSALDIPATAEDVVTSAQAAVRYLEGRVEPGSRVLVLGTDDLEQEVAAGGFLPVRDAEGVTALVQGLAPTTAWSDLAEAAVAIRAGALWVAGNTDSHLPEPAGPLPGNGALVQALGIATGQQPVVVGKPEPELHRASVERTGAQRPLVVGDRLDTDVLGAVRAGCDSLLVLTGVTDLEHLLAAPEGRRPTYVSTDLRGLVTSHEAPVVTDGTARCGSGKAWYEDRALRRSGPVEESLRAACALAWA